MNAIVVALLVCSVFSTFDVVVGQWGFDGPPMGGGRPPWMGPRPPWARPPWARRFGRPPWARPPWARPPWARGPPPMPPMEEPQQFQPPPQPQPQSQPAPQPAPQPVPQPAQYTPAIQRLVSSVNAYSAAFQSPGQGYENVLTMLKSYLGRQANIQYDFNSIRIPANRDRNELNANNKIASAVFETDVILTVPQMQAISGGSRWKRSLTSNMTLRWTSTTVPYRFATNDESWKATIRNALSHFHSNTCLRFVENQAGEDFLIYNQGEGCYSGVGRLGGPQEVSIGTGCETLGIIQHETGHALGLWHEQSRPERDSYIRVNIQNAVSGTEGQFEKRGYDELMNYNVQYDYGSMMHYSAIAFARSFSANTLEAIDNRYTHTIGSRVEASFLDYKALNAAYCSNICPSQLNCAHGGYADPNNCYQCLCPTGLGGTYCEALQPSNCGRDLTASEQWQDLSFSGSSNCYWRISTTAGNKILYEVTDVNFKCGVICEEFVEIKSGASHDATGHRQCCRADGGQQRSQSNDILIITQTTASSTFRLRYRAEILVRAPVPRPAAPRPVSRPAPRPTTRRPVQYYGPVPGALGASGAPVRNSAEPAAPAPEVADATPADVGTQAPALQHKKFGPVSKVFENDEQPIGGAARDSSSSETLVDL